MKKAINLIGIIVLTSLVFMSCNYSGTGEDFVEITTEDCKNDIRAYEFGREMQTWVVLRSSGLSLEDAINEYASGLGVYPPYEADNACVQRGFNDAESGKESPYNPDGKNWTSF
jgi:hypothetical protein